MVTSKWTPISSWERSCVQLPQTLTCPGAELHKPPSMASQSQYFCQPWSVQLTLEDTIFNPLSDLMQIIFWRGYLLSLYSSLEDWGAQSTTDSSRGNCPQDVESCKNPTILMCIILNVCTSICRGEKVSFLYTENAKLLRSFHISQPRKAEQIFLWGKISPPDQGTCCSAPLLPGMEKSKPAQWPQGKSRTMNKVNIQ